jgi:hypothetical protein
LFNSAIVFNVNNESVGKITTGADGMAELNNLPIGTYTLKVFKEPAASQFTARSLLSFSSFLSNSTVAF